MTTAERQERIKQLQEDHKTALAAPLMSEGNISPYQVGMMSERQKTHWQKMVSEKFDVLAEIKLLSRSDEQITQDEKEARIKKATGRITQINSKIEFLSNFHGKNGKILTKYVKEIARLTAEKSELTK